MTAAQRPGRLVIGLGNPDRGDDGVGVIVAESLAEGLPPSVAIRTRTGWLIERRCR